MSGNGIPRRMFLKGVGGYSLAIPFLPSLLPFSAKAADAPPPMRFAMILGKYGRDMSQWYPALADSALEAKDGGVLVKKFSDIPKPVSYCIGDAFNPILGKISLLRGLDTQSTQGNHNASLPTTGSSIDPSTIAGFGYSIDCVLEESTKFYPSLPVLGAFRTCPDIQQPLHEFVSFSYTSKTVTGQLLTPEWNPRDVYGRLLDPSAVQATNSKNTRIRNVTDLVLENFKQVMSGGKISSDDKFRLDSYMSHLSDVHKQLGVTAAVCAQAANPGSPTVLSEVHKAMIKLEVAALACGVSKIVMHSIAHNGDVLDPMWHQYAHGGEYAVNPATGRSYLSEYCKWHMDLVAYFLNQLDQIPEANGTLLDNTLFISGNEDGTGSHEHLDLPVLVAGGQGKLRTGYFMDFRPRPFFTLISREKAVIQAGRPYNSMLITAFRALGLNAEDYQKFGQQGFGRYDKPFVNAGSYYNQFLGAKTNDPLPFLFQG